MGGGAFTTVTALTSCNGPRNGSILAYILLGRKPLGCGHAGKCVNVDAVFSVSAMPYCKNALEADCISNLLFRSPDNRHFYLSASQTEKMGTCHFA